MRKGKSIVWIIIVAVVVILAVLIGIWQYRLYIQRKNIEKIEDQIMNGTYPGVN